jgi:hypothetical protein
MRKEFVQVVCILAIAVGAGLFAFGRHLDPPLDVQNPAALAMLQRGENPHVVASMACGLGVALMTGGILGVVLPWVNMWMTKCCVARLDAPPPTSTP